MASKKNNQNLLITIILVIVLIAIVFLTIKVYNLYTLNNYYRKIDNSRSEDEDLIFESDNMNLIPIAPRYRNRWSFWPSNWSWNSNNELGNNSWNINKYVGPGYKSGLHPRPFGNYCPYAGTCPFGGWKGCPYGSGCPGPMNLPTYELTRLPSLQESFD